MLAVVSEVPQTPEDWAIWSFHHSLSHRAIIDEVFATRQVQLTNYILDPLPAEKSQLPQWQEQNQLAHRDFNAVLKTNSLDLSVTDLSDPRQLIAWIQQHFLSHLAAETSLGIGS